MMNKTDLEGRIAELTLALEAEKKKNEMLSDYSDCALWEYEIADKRVVLSKKLDGKYSTTNMIIENYQQTMHGWNLVHPDDWDVFDAYCASMDRGEERFQYDVRQVTDEAMFVWLRYTGVTVYDQEHRPVKVIGRTMDVTQEKKDNEELIKKASCDSLTNLYNKEATRNLVQKYIHNPKSKDAGGAFIIVDVDDFKSVNDTWGHLYGDFVLKQVANILTMSSSPGDIVGRIGGDEFCMFCKRKSTEEALREVGKMILFKAENTQMKEDMHLRLSIGIALFPKDAHEYDMLFQAADKALYSAKQKGKNNFQFYEAGLTEVIRPKKNTRRRESNYSVEDEGSKETVSEDREVLLQELRYARRVMEYGRQTCYVVDANTYEFVYSAPTIRNVFPRYNEDSVCYRALFGKNEPCRDCPLTQAGHKEGDYSLEIYRSGVGKNYDVSVQRLEGRENAQRYLISWRDISHISKRAGVMDELTGTLNFHSFCMRLTECLEQKEKPYAVAMLGIRDFAGINETYGFARGEEIIKELAHFIMRNLVKEENICRVKGDDFLVLIDETDESAFERINHLFITFEALMAEKYAGCRINCYAGIYHIAPQDYLAVEVCDRARKGRELIKTDAEGKKISESRFSDGGD